MYGGTNVEDNFSLCFNNFVNYGLGMMNIGLRNSILALDTHLPSGVGGQHAFVILEVILLRLFDVVGGLWERLEFEIL